jgi:hypothetical protein
LMEALFSFAHKQFASMVTRQTLYSSQELFGGHWSSLALF